MSFDEDACYDTCLDVPHVHGGKLIAIPGGNGPPGIQGPAGPPGVSDVPGPTGPAGPQGAPGPVGPTGPASTVPGPAGATGPAGPTGPEGPAGIAGAKGDTGATGADGVQGVQGEQGPAGLGIRYKGEVTTVAELPTTGNVGGDLWVIGNRDDDSKPADSYVWDEDQQDWVYAGAIQGVQGVQGVQGPVGPEGPAGADGATGPAGPKGDTGDQGPPGETSGVVGPEGPQGPPGADGATGPAGPQGDVGPAGAKGDPGIQGPQGVAGADGATGPAGADGAPGVDGPAGPAGADGAPGPSAVSADADNATIIGTDGLVYTPLGGGAVGPQGPAGPEGPAGADGADGAPGPTAVSADANNASVLGTDGLIYTPSLLDAGGQLPESALPDGVELQANKGVNNGYASLDASGRIPSSQLSVSALEYKGTWDAAANDPPLVEGVGTPGDMWRVTVTGTQFGVKFTAGDFALFNGTKWETATSGTAGVSTVAGLTGDVAAGPLKTALALDKVDNTADATKNVLSATKLTTPRTINGVAFDGTANITVADATKEPIIAPGAAGQYLSGDKTWQDLPAAGELPVATATVLGGVKDGTGVVVAADGKLDLTPATTTALGGVKQGQGTTIAADGTVSAVKLTVDGVQVAEYDLDTTPLTASDVGAYTTAQVDSMLSDVVRLDAVQTVTRKSITLSSLTAPKVNQINDVSGYTSVQFPSVLNAVNYFKLANSVAGSGVSIYSDGTDASIPIIFVPKGTLPTISMWTNAAATAKFSVSGTPTDVSLDLVTKGTNGKVLANGVEVVRVTGAQTLISKTLTAPVMTDATIDYVQTPAGTAASFQALTPAALDSRLAEVEPAALPTNNFVQISGGIGTAPPSIIASGPNVDVPLYLAPRGSGAVSVYAATGRKALFNAAGPDANVDLSLAAKGATGKVLANGSPVVTGSTATGGNTLSLWTGTKAQYDAIPVGSRSATTIYVVTAAAAVTGDITAEAAEDPVVADPVTKTTRKK